MYPACRLKNIPISGLRSRLSRLPDQGDVHDVAVYKSQLYGVDAGEHPSWSIDEPEWQHPGYPPMNFPSGATVFKIDLV